jgi:hypothetical protein
MPNHPIRTRPVAAIALAALACLLVVPAPASAQGPAREQLTPTVAYHPETDRYLAVWAEDRGAGSDLYAKWLFSNGLPQGGAERAGFAPVRDPRAGLPGSSSGLRHDPSLVYNPDTEEFFLVWSEQTGESTGFDIYGQAVSSSGFTRGGPRRLTSGAGDETHPSVAYNSEREAYLVVWEDNARDIDEIRGLRLRTNGIPNGAPFAVISQPSNAQDPAVATREDGFLLVWVDDRNGNADLFARRINANGLPIGGPQGDDYALADSIEDELSPSLDPRSGTLVYNVFNGATGLDIVGLQIYDNGRARGTQPIGILVPAADQASPASAVNPARGETLVLFSDNRAGQFDLYALRVRNSRPIGRDYAVLSDGFTP